MIDKTLLEEIQEYPLNSLVNIASRIEFWEKIEHMSLFEMDIETCQLAFQRGNFWKLVMKLYKEVLESNY